MGVVTRTGFLIVKALRQECRLPTIGPSTNRFMVIPEIIIFRQHDFIRDTPIRKRCEQAGCQADSAGGRDRRGDRTSDNDPQAGQEREYPGRGDYCFRYRKLSPCGRFELFSLIKLRTSQRLLASLRARRCSR